MFKKIINKIKELILADPSPSKLTLAISIGIFFAFSPFLFVMTWLAIGVAWLCGVSMPIAAASLNLINNPWSMIPLLMLNYYVGTFITEKILAVNLLPYNPSFMNWINKKIGSSLAPYLGSTELCFWCYFIGGIVVATIITIISYPIVYVCLKRWLKKTS